ncbi:MAG: hypothetical protein K2W33_06680 [Burkholderiales bacterium]|nr:hypothetical protein [Burkholderiales bacterium]
MQHLFTPKRLGQLALAALVVWCLTAAVQVVVPAMAADIAIIKTRWQIDQWASGKAPQPGIVAWGRARNAVADAISITPNDPNLHENLAYLYASRAQASAFVPDLARDLSKQALASYQRSVQLRPMSGPTRSNIAQVMHTLAADNATPEDLAPMWVAFDKAMAYGQREPSVQLTLAHIGFARWETMPAIRQQALLAVVDAATAETRPTIDAIAARYNQAQQLPPAPASSNPAPNQ